ncbi:MAG: peptidyl-prolyl cis-trans isomerase [Porticoccus sp.]
MVLSLVVIGSFSVASVADTDSVNKLTGDEVFATVGDQVITVGEFSQYLREAMRQKFYHPNIPKEQAEPFMRDAGEKLVERTLLLMEAENRGVVLDDAVLAEKLVALERKYERNPDWAGQREQLLPSLKKKVREESLLSELERQVKETGDLSDSAIREYYDNHSDKFTQPEQRRASVILLKVPPSSGPDVWESAHDKAVGIRKKLLAGDDFSQLAREFSEDVTAANGGDMGLQHFGVLGPQAESILIDLDVGNVSEPAMLLEGVVLLKLTGIVPPVLTPYDQVKLRAKGLLRRELGELAWKRLVFELNQSTKVEVNEKYYQ